MYCIIILLKSRKKIPAAENERLRDYWTTVLQEKNHKTRKKYRKHQPEGNGEWREKTDSDGRTSLEKGSYTKWNPGCTDLNPELSVVDWSRHNEGVQLKKGATFLASVTSK